MRRSLWMLLAALVFVGAGVIGSIQAASETRVKITNRLERYTIYYVYVSPGSSDSWGDDQLGSGEVLSPGNSRMWTVDPGTWDLRVKDEDGDTYTKRGIEVPRGMTIEWEVTLADLDASSGSSETRIRIRNGLERYTIYYVYLSPDEASNWGEDKLDSGEVISPGEARDWTVSAGTYDLRVKDEDGDMYTKNNVRVSAGSTYEWRVTLSDMDDD